MCCYFMPCKLVRQFHVHHFHVQHFQRPRWKLTVSNPTSCLIYKSVYSNFATASGELSCVCVSGSLVLSCLQSSSIRGSTTLWMILLHSALSSVAVKMSCNPIRVQPVMLFSQFTCGLPLARLPSTVLTIWVHTVLAPTRHKLTRHA